jgi:Uma2 family endonuclease
MDMTTAQSITTAEQLLAAGDIGRCELVRGELIMMSPAGWEHGNITYELSRLLGNHIKARGLGKVCTAETGFILARHPDTVRAPDIAFVRTERLPRERRRGFYDGPPDLAVEVVSPDDRASEIQAKVQEWFVGGCHLVWVVDPQTRTITVYQPDRSVQVLRETDELTGGDVVPGFTLAVRQVFEAV